MKTTHLSIHRLTAILVLLLSWQTQAGEPVTNSSAPIHLTLAQAIDEAFQMNPGLKAAGHQSRAAEGDASAAARSRWGGLNAVGSYSYLNDDQIIRPMSSELLANGFAGAPWDRSQAHYGVSYEIPLYLGGRLNNQIQIATTRSPQNSGTASKARAGRCASTSSRSIRPRRRWIRRRRRSTNRLPR